MLVSGKRIALHLMSEFIQLDYTKTVLGAICDHQIIYFTLMRSADISFDYQVIDFGFVVSQLFQSLHFFEHLLHFKIIKVTRAIPHLLRQFSLFYSKHCFLLLNVWDSPFFYIVIRVFLLSWNWNIGWLLRWTVWEWVFWSLWVWQQTLFELQVF